MPETPTPTASPTAPTTERLLSLVDGFGGQSIAIVADLVVDRFITGTPKRVSREAPVLILHQEGDERRPGGGANAIANVAALGGSAHAVGIVGEDDNGQWLRDHLAELTGTASGIASRASYCTPTKTRILGGSPGTVKQQIVRFDIEDSVELDEAAIEATVAAVEQAQPAVVLLSDYGYGAVPPAVAARLRSRLPKSTRLLCDSRFRLSAFDSVHGATPNLEEVEAIVGARIDTDPARLAGAGRSIVAETGMDFLLITRGSAGMSLFSEGSIAEVPVHGTDQVADVTGAGDTVIGTFALALAAGATALEATLLANYAGGIVVMKAGTATLTQAELCQAIESDSAPLEGLQWAEY